MVHTYLHTYIHTCHTLQLMRRTLQHVWGENVMYNLFLRYPVNTRIFQAFCLLGNVYRPPIHNRKPPIKSSMNRLGLSAFARQPKNSPFVWMCHSNGLLAPAAPYATAYKRALLHRTLNHFIALHQTAPQCITPKCSQHWALSASSSQLFPGHTIVSRLQLFSKKAKEVKHQFNASQAQN